ncbi:sensor histidine kinase [Methanothermobacter wolfeii]|uniref:sensor histidine kinase n=1 Tax=Methanothermobacter wolfeii TaxID=145261 RepID=UPI0024B3B727|nr:histidine kinase dimerization/phosphoacceptor domain -containing protein [Methanothermobacter wolfeii]MDI6702095.1 histidine kinase dimerization/phosphoacceptor domain -containing protein [Methanothermobacter wolfeii]
MVWILVSDYKVYLNGNVSLIFELSVLKGSVFIILTSLLLYALLRTYLVSLMEREDSLRASEEKFRTLFMELSVGLALFDENWVIVESNPIMEEIFNGQVIGKVPGELDGGLLPEPGRESLLRRDDRWIRVGFQKIRGGFLGIFEDVTDIKRSEEAARESLERNRALLAELHHRVKNSLQLILSLINLQSYRLGDEETVEAMRSLQRRIKSIAIIHEILLSRGDIDAVDFRDYTMRLTSYLKDLYRSDAGIRVDVPELALNTETAIPLGIIMDELVSNSIRHLPEGGEITVSLEEKDDGFILSVTDNGPGLPDDFSIEESGGLGMELVRNLAAQLNGRVSYESGDGTAFRVEFTELRYAERL